MGAPGDYNLARNALGNRPALTFLEHLATVDGREMKLITFDQKNAGLNTAEINRDPVHDEVKQFIKLQNLGDLLCCFLHADECVNPALLENCGSLAGESGSRCGSHGSVSLTRLDLLDSRTNAADAENVLCRLAGCGSHGAPLPSTNARTRR